MKSRILLFTIFFFVTGFLFAQNAQEVFDQDLETLKVSLKKYKPDSINRKEAITIPPTTKEEVDKEKIEIKKKPISCQEIENTIASVDNLLKQKVGIRADNKLKINKVLSTIPAQTKIDCKDPKVDCCEEQLKLFEDFCRINGFLEEVFPEQKKE